MAADRIRTRFPFWAKRAGGGLIAAAATLTLGACATDPMPPIRADWAAGNYEAARAALAGLEQSDSSNRQLYRLERAMTELALGRPAVAEQALAEARDRLDDLKGKGALEWFGSAMTDDRSLDFEGTDYENVLVRALLALTNLMDDGGDAFAYSLQVLERQLELIQQFETEGEDNPKSDYRLVAIGSYLRAIMAEEDPFQKDSAQRAMARVLELEPEFAYGKADQERIQNGRHCARGNGVLHVIALTGRAPFRVETNVPAAGGVLAIAQAIWASIRGRANFPNISQVVVPRLAFHRDNPTTAFVSVNGQQVGETATVTDVNQIAQAEFDAMSESITVRAVLRRAFKLAVTEGAKEIFNPKKKERVGGTQYERYDASDAVTDILVSLGGLLWTAAERADLRSWSLLPGAFQVLRVELPAGRHQISIRVGRDGRPTGADQVTNVFIRDGYNTYVLAISPTLRGGPPPLTSSPADAGSQSGAERDVPRDQALGGSRDRIDG